MISPSNTSPVLTSDLAGNAGPHYHKGYYRVTDNDLIEASIVAKFSYEVLGLRTMVTIHDGDAYTSAISNAFLITHVSGCVEVRINGGHRCGAVAIPGAGGDSERRVGV